MSVEERVRAAAQAAAGQVREVRPLDLPAVQLTSRTSLPRPRWPGWLVPLAAAAAIILIAVGLAIINKGQNGPATPLPSQTPSPAPTQPPTASGACGGARSAAATGLPGDVPQYFVELCGGLNTTGRIRGTGRLVAADIRTGAILGSVPAPSGLTGIYGTADDQAFLVSGSHGTPKGPHMGLWVLRLVPGAAHPVTLTLLPWTLTSPVLSMTVSPDGTKIAAALNATVPGSVKMKRSRVPVMVKGKIVLRWENFPTGGLEPVNVYSLATGKVLRSWSFNGLVDALEWTGDGTALVYQGDSQTFLVHPIAAPGSGLAAGSTPLLTLAPATNSGPCTGASDWLVTSDGSMIICPESTVPSVPGPAGQCQHAQLGFALFAAGSRLPGSSPAGTVYSVTDPCASQTDTVSLMWACPDGTQVIGQVSYTGHDEVGYFAGSTFIPIPALGGTAPNEPWMIAF